MKNRTARLKVIKAARAALDRKRRTRSQGDPCGECGRTLFTDGVPDPLVMTTTPGQLMSYCPACVDRAKEVNPNVRVVTMPTPSREDIDRRLAEEFGAGDPV